MSELPFSIPTNNAEFRALFLETRDLIESLWQGYSEEVMTLRPGPHPEWSVKDIIAHLCWWETFAIARVGVLSAGLPISPIQDLDGLNKQVDALILGMPLEVVLAVFETNKKQFLHLIDQFTFEEWADETRPNFEGSSLMELVGANTFGHYYDHLDDLKAFREKQLG
ncbi:MAG TPA: DinB family protein [Anaerolineales bacterium]|nr:DinB family protein [Anaerolineales bacterium]